VIFSGPALRKRLRLGKHLVHDSAGQADIRDETRGLAHEHAGIVDVASMESAPIAVP
jgi:hypothetical protein